MPEAAEPSLFPNPWVCRHCALERSVYEGPCSRCGNKGDGLPLWQKNEADVYHRHRAKTDPTAYEDDPFERRKVVIPRDLNWEEHLFGKAEEPGE